MSKDGPADKSAVSPNVAIKSSSDVSKPDRESDAQAVQNDVRTFVAAIFESDVDTVLGFTHPKIVEMLGGMAKAREDLKGTLVKVNSTGMKVESFDFPEPPKFFRTETTECVIVPTLTITSANGTRVESLNFQFGCREIGTSKWVYIEGSRIHQKNVRDFVPDFPADFEFPKFYRKKL